MSDHLPQSEGHPCHTRGVFTPHSDSKSTGSPYRITTSDYTLLCNRCRILRDLAPPPATLVLVTGLLVVKDEPPPLLFLLLRLLPLLRPAILLTLNISRDSNVNTDVGAGPLPASTPPLLGTGGELGGLGLRLTIRTGPPV